MILKSITLSGWRRFSNPARIGPFSERMNVIFAPNGAGKSTIFEALRCGMLDKHDVSGAGIEAVRPWNRQLSPSVEITFSVGGEDYRVSKTFLDGAQSTLSRHETGVFTALASGRAADEQTRAFLSRSAPGRGLAQRQYWGLAQALWAPQGGLELDSLSDDLIADIQAILGAQVGSRAAAPLELRIKKWYEEYYTGQGRLRTGANAPELVRLLEQRDNAHMAVDKARERHADYETLSRRVKELQGRRVQMAFQADELRSTIARQRSETEEYRALCVAIQQKKGEAETAEAKYQQAKQHYMLARSTRETVDRLTDEVKQLEENVVFARLENESRQRERDELRIQMQREMSDRSTVETAECLARAARRHADAAAAVAELDQRIERISAAEAALKSAMDRSAACVAPDKKTVSQLRKATQSRDEALLHIDASLISLEIVPDAERTVEVTTGEQRGEITLPQHTATVIKGTPAVEVVLPGVGRFRAAGPTVDIEEHRETLRKAREKMEALTAPFGNATIETLEALLETRQILDAKVENARVALTALLAGDTLDALRETRAVQGEILRQLHGEHPEWEETPPDHDALDRAATALHRARENRIREAERALEIAGNTCDQTSKQLAQVETRLASTRQALEQAKSDLDTLRRGGETEAEDEREAERLLMTWDAARAALRALEERCARFRDNPVAALETLEAQLTATEEEAHHIRDEEMSAEGRLGLLAADGPYSALVSAEEEASRLDAEIERQEIARDAAKLLYDTLDGCRREAVAAVSLPVERIATRYFQRIAGGRLGGVALGADFAPKSARPERSDAPVGLDNLSGGEREQLYLATRLALAETLARDERHMLALDDALTATDAGRFARILNLLEEASGRLQIVVLTCHPERYRALKQATFLDLEAAIADGVTP